MSDDQGRPESGPMKFGSDWTGLFLRGDDAAPHAFMLESHVLPKVQDDVIAESIVDGLITTFKAVMHEPGKEAPADVQKMKPWAEAVDKGEEVVQMPSGSTKDLVEAVLLNSEGDPGEEVQAALNALVYFALGECEATTESLQHMLQIAFKAAAERVKAEG